LLVKGCSDEQNIKGIKIYPNTQKRYNLYAGKYYGANFRFSLEKPNIKLLGASQNETK
jgi:hypothetical protein